MSVFTIFRKKAVAAVALVAVVLGVVLGRLFVGIPLVPPSGREVVARISKLPIPLFAESERAVDKCSGFLCMDYYGSGFVRLNANSCSKVVAAAKAKDWRPLPLPSDLTVVDEEGSPPTPHDGFFLFTQPNPEEQRFAWIDTDTCHVYAELSLE